MPVSVDGSDNPSVRPWISASGIGGGMDVSWITKLEFVNPDTGEVLTERAFGLELTFTETKREDGVPAWKYMGGRWVSDSKAVSPAPAELGITIDWILNSDLFKGFMEKQLTQSLAWEKMGTLQFKRVGQALGRNRRPGGGYYAEALVIEVRPSF